jgi:hypothetical protein
LEAFQKQDAKEKKLAPFIRIPDGQIELKVTGDNPKEKKSDVTFLMFISSSFLKEDHDHGI